MRFSLVLLACAVALLAPAVALAQSYPHCAPGQTPRFEFGFQALYEAVGYAMGEPMECAHAIEGGDVVQQTSTGLARYRAASNTPTFIAGDRHWALTPEGLVYWVGDDLDPPAGALRFFGAGASGVEACGAYTITWSNPELPVEQPTQATLVATDSAGVPVLSVSRQADLFESVWPQWCGDPIGDGRVVFLYTTYSGGAHCCVSAYLQQLEPFPAALLEWELGNAGGLTPLQLDGGRPLELASASDVFAYFDEIPYAASPFLPLAFAFDGAAYREATRSFPDYIAADLDQALEAVDAAVQGGEPAEAIRGQALRAFADYALLGQAEEGLRAVEQRLPPDDAAWLEAHAAEVLAIVERSFAPPPG